MYTAALTAGKHVSPGLVNSPFHQQHSAFWKIGMHTHMPSIVLIGPKLGDPYAYVLLLYFSKRRWMKQAWLWSSVTCNWKGFTLWFVYLSVKPRLVFKQTVSCFSLETGWGLRVVFSAFEQSHCLWLPAPEWLIESGKNVLTVIFHSWYLCCRMPQQFNHGAFDYIKDLWKKHFFLSWWV